MKGTILDFLNLAATTPDLSQDLVALAAKYGFEFSDEVSEEELKSVTGGQKLTEAPPDEPLLERSKYFDGKLLEEKDLQEEQKYPWSKPAG